MAVSRIFNQFTLFDIFGNLIPGTIVLAAVVSVFPMENATQIASAPLGTQFLLAIIAFALGHVIQQHASEAAGKRETFKNTILSARSYSYSPSTALDDYGRKRKALYLPYYCWNERVGDPIRKRFRGSIVGRLAVLPARLYRSVVEAVLLVKIKKDEPLPDNRLASKVWMICKKKYRLDKNYDNYGDLLHLMSSDLENHGTSRALRFQAIRNFQRGMWIACFYASILYLWVSLSDFLPSLFYDALAAIGLRPWTPAIIDIWSPVWTLMVVTGVVSYSFWELKEKYEEEFIEYLFTDYVTSQSEDLT
ncbi:hypothetical protein [Halorussus pelagicus]|uniref:hypothetical protein n=1 Tax=Halorussus pelagicus TaxID=2505977 RepID=UPI000FFBCA24|nr:hypothetical protein [Halorussus pelagicus]